MFRTASSDPLVEIVKESEENDMSGTELIRNLVLAEFRLSGTGD